MTEYLYNCILASADTDTEITAKITDEAGNNITEDCSLNLYDDQKMIVDIKGTYTTDGFWNFVIPKEKTEGFRGRYFYEISHLDSKLCFKQPIYFK